MLPISSIGYFRVTYLLSLTFRTDSTPLHQHHRAGLRLLLATLTTPIIRETGTQIHQLDRLLLLIDSAPIACSYHSSLGTSAVSCLRSHHQQEKVYRMGAFSLSPLDFPGDDGQYDGASDEQEDDERDEKTNRAVDRGCGSRSKPEIH